MFGALSRVSCLEEREDLVQAALTFCGGTTGDALETVRFSIIKHVRYEHIKMNRHIKGKIKNFKRQKTLNKMF